MAGQKTAALEFNSAELTSGGSVLFKHLLSQGVGVADPDDVLLTSSTAHHSIIELLHGFFANVTTLEPRL